MSDNIPRFKTRTLEIEAKQFWPTGVISMPVPMGVLSTTTPNGEVSYQVLSFGNITPQELKPGDWLLPCAGAGGYYDVVPQQLYPVLFETTPIPDEPSGGPSNDIIYRAIDGAVHNVQGGG